MTRSWVMGLALLLWAPLCAAQSKYATDVLSMNPAGYWRLDGNANDATNQGNNGTVSAGVGFTNPGAGAPIGDPNNQAGVFTGTNATQYINFASTASLSLFAFDSNRPMTMMIWAKTADAANAPVMLGKLGGVRGPAFVVDNGSSVAPVGSGRLSFALYADATHYIGVAGTSVSINDGKWHFLVATYDGSGDAAGVRLFIDGAPESAKAYPTGNSLAGMTAVSTGPVTIGGSAAGTSFNGMLDEAAFFPTALAAAQIQQLWTDATAIQKILPQFVFGGGWYSALYFANTGSGTVTFPVSFIADNGLPLTVPAVAGPSTTITLATRGTAIIEAPNAGSLNQGWASVSLPDGVVGYGVFRQSVQGVPDQEAVVPLTGIAATSSTLIWDETSYTTGVAIVNPSSVATTVAIVARDRTGAIIGNGAVALAAKSKTAVVLKNVPGLAAMANNRGLAEFTVTTGNVSVLGLRFDGPAFTSIPTTER